MIQTRGVCCGAAEETCCLFVLDIVYSIICLGAKIIFRYIKSKVELRVLAYTKILLNLR